MPHAGRLVHEQEKTISASSLRALILAHHSMNNPRIFHSRMFGRRCFSQRR